MLIWVWINAGDFSLMKRVLQGVVSLNENDLLSLAFEYLAYSWWDYLRKKKRGLVEGVVSLGLGLGFSKTHAIPNVLSASCLWIKTWTPRCCSCAVPACLVPCSSWWWWTPIPLQLQTPINHLLQYLPWSWYFATAVEKQPVQQVCEKLNKWISNLKPMKVSRLVYTTFHTHDHMKCPRDGWMSWGLQSSI